MSATPVRRASGPSSDRVRVGFAALVLGVCATAASAQAFDVLALVPEVVAEPTQTRSLGLRLEVWDQRFDWRHRPQGARSAQQRVLLDLRREWAIEGGRTRLGVSNRLERVFTSSPRAQTRNALRELYISHELQTGWFVDVGRINWRNGVASGFNPTDYLRRGTVVEQGSLDPRALRENRLGTVMMRQQWVGASGSAQLALIPSLRAHGGDSPTAPGWARSNPGRAALLKLSPTLGQRTSVDGLVYQRAGEGPQFGANLTHLLGDALVLHAEGSTGSRRTRDHAPRRRYHDWVTGLTWTSAAGPIVTAELQRDAETDRRAAFVRMAWDDVFGVRETSAVAFVRHDLDRDDRLWQLELNWHLTGQHGLSLIVGGLAGSAPVRRYATLSWRAYF